MPREYISARDSTGHGTHTASTVGGSSVSMASVLGSGAGVARGMAPGAHIAVYKVCWFNGCYSSDILAAIDVAIQDKVDILSLSLGGFPIPSQLPLELDLMDGTDVRTPSLLKAQLKSELTISCLLLSLASV